MAVEEQINATQISDKTLQALFDIGTLILM